MISSCLKVLQVNLNRSTPATESALQLVIELKVDLILVQEPWLIPRNLDQDLGPAQDYTSTRSISHPSFTQILPPTRSVRPRTMAYASRTLKPTVSLANSPDSDLLILDIQEGSYTLQVLNIYNETSQTLGIESKTIARALTPIVLQQHSIVLGDFNTHHPWWDPLAACSPDADRLVDWIDQNNLSLLNTPGVGTFYRPNLARESVLDLTLATATIASRIQDWQVLPDLGSDHYGILFTVIGTGQNNLFENPIQTSRYNTSLANWDLFATTIKSSIANNPIFNTPSFLSLQTDKLGIRTNSP